MVTAGERHGSMTQVWSNDTPVIDEVSPPNSPATGKVSITLSGVDFVFCPFGRLGFSGAEASNWVSASSLVCKSTTGTNVPGSDLGTVVTAGVKAGSLSQAFTFNSPISSFHPANQAMRSTAWTSSLTVYGSDFGKSETSLASRFGESGTQASQWMSDSVMSCHTSAGLGPSLSAAITVAGAVDSATMMVSYDALQIASVIRVVQITVSLVFATASNIGTVQGSVRARESETGCEYTEWISDTVLVCKPSASFSTGHSKFVVTSASSVSTRMTAFAIGSNNHLSSPYATPEARSARSLDESPYSRWESDTELLVLVMHDDIEGQKDADKNDSAFVLMQVSFGMQMNVREGRSRARVYV